MRVNSNALAYCHNLCRRCHFLVGVWKTFEAANRTLDLGISNESSRRWTVKAIRTLNKVKASVALKLPDAMMIAVLSYMAAGPRRLQQQAFAPALSTKPARRCILYAELGELSCR
jgi:hypothetical protein